MNVQINNKPRISGLFDQWYQRRRQCLVHDDVPHFGFVVEVSGDIPNQIAVVVGAIFPLMVECFY